MSFYYFLNDSRRNTFFIQMLFMVKNVADIYKKKYYIVSSLLKF